MLKIGCNGFHTNKLCYPFRVELSIVKLIWPIHMVKMSYICG